MADYHIPGPGAAGAIGFAIGNQQNIEIAKWMALLVILAITGTIVIEILHKKLSPVEESNNGSRWKNLIKNIYKWSIPILVISYFIIAMGFSLFILSL